jgi:hypothetical protein
MKSGVVIISIAAVAIVIFVLALTLHLRDTSGNRAGIGAGSGSTAYGGRQELPGLGSFGKNKDPVINELLTVLHQQNETIAALGKALEAKGATAGSSATGASQAGLGRAEAQLLETLKQKEAEIERLLVQQENMLRTPQDANGNKPQQQVSSATGDPTRAQHMSHHIPDYLLNPTRFQADCEHRYGLELVDKWKHNRFAASFMIGRIR